MTALQNAADRTDRLAGRRLVPVVLPFGVLPVVGIAR